MEKYIDKISCITGESGKIIGNSLKNIELRIKDTVSKEKKKKSFNEFVNELYMTWEKLSESEQIEFAEKLVGRYNLKNFAALMNSLKL